MTVQRLSQNPAPVSLPATGRLSTHESIRLNPPNDAKSPWREQPTSPTDVHNGKNSNTTDPRVFVSSHPVHSEMQQVRESRSETLLAPNIQFEKRNEHGIRTMAESEPAGLPGGGVHPVANLKSVDGSLPAKPPPAKKPMPSPDDFCYSWGQPRQSSPYASYPFGNGEADPERNQTTTNEGDVPTAKRIIYGVLTEWALEPPALQSLRPIEYLLSSIHTVFPPRFGIPPHAHFLQWTPILEPSELTVASVVGSQPNDVVIGKVLRKLRFLLHSDKLPQDFSEEQRLLCKLLWDIVNDALEQYKGRSEEMG